LVRLYIIRGTAAITVILATRTRATTLATTVMAGEATIGLGGGIGTMAGITAGIMAGGTEGGAVAGAVVAGAAVDGTVVDGTAIIDSESRSGCCLATARRCRV
jgi:hypothetical protein